MVVLPGTFIANRYEVIAQLGGGSFGTVYKVRDHHQDMIVALKLLDPASLPSPFPWNEATMLTKLASPYVLSIHNASFAGGGVPFIVTALAPSGDLETAIATLGTDPGRAVKFVRQAARGLTRAHDDGVLHRDIKLGNLFLTAGGDVLVGDFGLSHPMDAAGLAPWGGTKLTMAPEVLKGGPCSVATDVYSLGASAYRLLTGVYPFVDRSTPVTFLAVASAEEPTPVRDLAPHVPRGLAARIETAIARRPGDRYPTATAFDAALGEYDYPEHRWTRTDHHLGHEGCWTGTRERGKDHEVCWEVSGRRSVVTVRKMPGDRKVRRLCADVPSSQALSKLRKAFERLG